MKHRHDNPPLCPNGCVVSSPRSAGSVISHVVPKISEVVSDATSRTDLYDLLVPWQEDNEDGNEKAEQSRHSNRSDVDVNWDIGECNLKRRKVDSEIDFERLGHGNEKTPRASFNFPEHREQILADSSKMKSVKSKTLKCRRASHTSVSNSPDINQQKRISNSRKLNKKTSSSAAVKFPPSLGISSVGEKAKLPIWLLEPQDKSQLSDFIRSLRERLVFVERRLHYLNNEKRALLNSLWRIQDDADVSISPRQQATSAYSDRFASPAVEAEEVSSRFRSRRYQRDHSLSSDQVTSSSRELTSSSRELTSVYDRDVEPSLWDVARMKTRLSIKHFSKAETWLTRQSEEPHNIAPDMGREIEDELDVVAGAADSSSQPSNACGTQDDIVLVSDLAIENFTGTEFNFLLDLARKKREAGENIKNESKIKVKNSHEIDLVDVVESDGDPEIKSVPKIEENSVPNAEKTVPISDVSETNSPPRNKRTTKKRKIKKQRNPSLDTSVEFTKEFWHNQSDDALRAWMTFFGMKAGKSTVRRKLMLGELAKVSEYLLEPPT